jgi:glycine oxidase
MYEVLVIGGGVIGLAIAREVRKAGGGAICIVDEGECGREASWAAAGMLSADVDAHEIDALHGMCSASRDLYPQLAEELYEETAIDIQLDRTGTIAVAFGIKQAAELSKRTSEQTKTGIEVLTLSRRELFELEPALSLEATAGALYPNDWQVENRKLLTALRRYADLNALDIRENTRVGRVIINSGRAVGVETTRGRILAKRIVIATGAWTSFIKLGDDEMPVVVQPVRGQMICFDGPQVLRHVVHSPDGYLVPRFNGRTLAGATSERAGFDNTLTDDARIALLEMATRIGPVFGERKVIDQWSGLRPFAEDGLPVIGEIPGISRLFLATGHYRNGILLAPITARLAAEWLRQVDRVYFTRFGPDRFARRSANTGNC